MSSSRISEIILFVVLVVIAGFTRIYYGAAVGPMVVWKSEFSYKDTLVNLADVLKLPANDIAREHAQVFDQLEDMGLMDAPALVTSRKPTNKKPLLLPDTAKGPGVAPVTAPSEKPVPNEKDSKSPAPKAPAVPD